MDAASPWGVRPHLFDIVWAHFPYHGEGGRPADDLHPCLIIAVGEDENVYWAGCVYGTSKIRSGERDQIDAIVMNCAELDAMGLPKATRFDFDRAMWLPWDQRYFVESKTNPGSPIHGRATDALRAEVRLSLQIRIERSLPAYPVKPPIPTIPPWVPDGTSGPNLTKKEPAAPAAK